MSAPTLEQTELVTDVDNGLFIIPEWNLPKVNKLIKKLNNKATKHNCSLIKITDFGPTEIKDPKAEYAWQYTIKVHQIKIENTDEIKISGWTFIGSMDHATLGDACIIKTVPGHEIPSKFFNAKPICEHCNKQRRRNDTFILKNENDEYKQVGRQCLKDFFGHDPKHLIGHLTRLFKFIEELKDEQDYNGGCGYTAYSFDHVDILTLTAATIRTFGWVPRSKADDYTSSTADVIALLMVPSHSLQRQKEKEKLMDSIKFNKEQDLKDAQNAIKWLDDQSNTDSTSYMHNLTSIKAASSVPVTMFGFWCSLLSIYYKNQTKENEKSKYMSEWVGDIKQRMEFNIEVQNISYISGAYGTVEIYRMVDDNNRIIVWFANTSSKMEKGKSYKIRATVKKHDEYKNMKQTVVSRAIIIKELNND